MIVKLLKFSLSVIRKKSLSLILKVKITLVLILANLAIDLFIE